MRTMNPSRCRFASILILSLLAATLLSAQPAAASLFDSYTRQPSREFDLPAISSAPGTSQGGTQMDNLPDGRLVLVTTRITAFFTGYGEVRVETAPGSHVFNYVGDLPLPTLDNIWYNPPVFLTINQQTGKVAVGNGSGSLGIFDANNPGGVQWFEGVAGGNFLGNAAWRNGTQLAVTSSDFAENRVDLLNITNGHVDPVIAGPADINGVGSGGVAFDAAGNAYVGVGYGSAVGEIRKFDTSTWPTPVQLFTDGTLVTTQLSAAWLQFDSEGNLLVGGADTFGGSGHTNYFSIVDPSGQVRSFDPDGNSVNDAYNVVYNQHSGEILVWDDSYGSDPLHVFVFAADAVPEPASLTLLAGGGMMLAVGMWRRRRVVKAA
ncbi:MAG: PEP-CTERM sorting domain-containing protein [Planctomycetia bacterium]|nr:PEP-CTERM sorting domain-containing protein [Planctomycetia bacterium]